MRTCDHSQGARWGQPDGSKAIDMAVPGDVIVVDAGGYLGQAVVGEIMATYAYQRGVNGFVIDGAVRDLDYLSRSSLPVFSSGISPRGPSRVGPGEINVSVTVGGMVVHPGDIIISDSDGIFSVSQHDAEELLAKATFLPQKKSSSLPQCAPEKLIALGSILFCSSATVNS